MPIQIIREDITKIKCDAIVNPTNSSMIATGGVDGAIHRAAGIGMLAACKALGGCETGKAKITGGYNLPCKYVIHTVGPVWRGGNYREKELLESCYRESLMLAKRYGCETVAFPLLSSGIYGYPKDQALKVAIDTIGSFLLKNDMLVYVVIFDKTAYQISQKLFTDIKSYIDNHYVEQHSDRSLAYSRQLCVEDTMDCCECDYTVAEPMEMARPSMPLPCEMLVPQRDTASKLDFNEGLIDIVLDESFSEMLLRRIDEKGMTDAECYKKANIDRKLFSKIRNNVHYSPSKATAIAFAIALEMDLKETKEFLEKAGYALSHSNKFDVIIEYFIKNRNYNVFEINEVLFAFDQTLLGC